MDREDEFQKVELEKKTVEEELIAFRSRVERLLKAKQSLRQDLGKAESRSRKGADIKEYPKTPRCGMLGETEGVAS